MFGLEYLLALMKVMTNIGFSIITAIPMWLSWNCIAPKYLSAYVPTVFLDIPYWHVVAFFLVFTFMGEQIQKLTPKIISIDNSSKNG